VDDLAIVSQNPQKIIDKFKNPYNFKLKGTGPLAYHLGANFERDQNGILYMSPSKYIDRMIKSYLYIFGTKPKTIYSSPLEKGDHIKRTQSVSINDWCCAMDCLTQPI